MLEIRSNGAKWFNEEPDTIKSLIEVLKTETLDPSFEANGNFVIQNPTWLTEESKEKYKGCTVFFGNFLGYSHVFNITTDEPETIEPLTVAIRENQTTEKYQQARQRYLKRESVEQKARRLFNEGKITQKEMYGMMY